MAIIPQKLEELRIAKYKEIGKTDFARLIGSSPATYSHVISGNRLPSITFLENLCKATNENLNIWKDWLAQDKLDFENLKSKKNNLIEEIRSLKALYIDQGEYPSQTFFFNKHNNKFLEKEDVKNNNYITTSKKNEEKVDLKSMFNRKDPKFNTCYETLELLVKMNKITSPEDVYNDETVKDMILAASKYEIEKLLKEKDEPFPFYGKG